MLKNGRLSLLLMTVALFVFGIYGCGKISPTAPEDSDLGATPAEPPRSGLPSQALWPRLMIDCDTVYHQARVEADKDNYIHLLLPGWYNYFVVPEGAVDQDVTITIAVSRYHYWDEETGETSLVAFYEFRPDGLTFGAGDGDYDHDNHWHYGGYGGWYDDDDDHHHHSGYNGWHAEEGQLAYLVLNASWIDLHYGEEAVLRYYNEDTGLWEEISSTTVRYSRVKFYFDHFSKYAISR